MHSSGNADSSECNKSSDGTENTSTKPSAELSCGLAVQHPNSTSRFLPSSLTSLFARKGSSSVGGSGTTPDLLNSKVRSPKSASAATYNQDDDDKISKAEKQLALEVVEAREQRAKLELEKLQSSSDVKPRALESSPEAIGKALSGDERLRG